ncbi:cytochrome P450 [Aeromicrobium sp.]|uniref:cytochrome P450 n=1 Tax=Aeromicrobium sp. TaxID=1871063 RepID=UPI0025BE93EF|nr:cytochrome P450 [Aeromicrobium sp.]MCK5892322.1 cytochrome P450 [Aeromicrobium sp.]
MTASQLDLADPAFVADPYPALAELRAAGDLLWHEPSGRWLATTHAAVTQVLRDRSFGRLWTDHEPADVMEPFNTLHRNQLMENEPPEHTRMRRLLAGAFGRGHVERLRPGIESLAAEMVARLVPGSDLLADFAEPFPVFVIADLLGFPRADHALLRDWSQAIVHMYESDVDEPTRAAAVRASTDFAAYVREIVEHRRTSPGDDLVTDLIAARDGAGPDGGQKLSDDELVATVVLLLNAGHEASVNTFGNGLVALLAHPEQEARVRSGEVDVATALEELIRFDAPLQLFERTATADAVVDGQVVRTGEVVACLMGSANRDPVAFEDADAFVVSRDPNPHVGFGMGLHFCLGAPLARLELQISLRTLLARFGTIELRESPRRPTWVLRGYESLVCELSEAP